MLFSSSYKTGCCPPAQTKAQATQVGHLRKALFRLIWITSCRLILLAVLSAGLILPCTTDVTTAGAKGDDSTDNTLVLQKIFDTIRTNTTACRSVYFPTGIYRITRQLTVDLGSISIYGDSSSSSSIKQMSANTGILIWLNEGPYATQIYVHDLAFENANWPSAVTTQQWALRFQCTPSGAGGTQLGYWLNHFERLQINSVYIGVGTFTQPGGGCPFWSSSFRDIEFYQIQHSAIAMAPSVGSTGPSDVFDRIDILNHGNVLRSDGPAVQVWASHGLVLRAINIEDWYNSAYDLRGGGGTVIDAPRFERHHFTNTWGNATPNLFYLGNNDFTVRAMDIDMIEASQSGIASIFALGAGSLNVSGVYAHQTLPQTNIMMFRGDPNTAKVNYQNLVLNQQIYEYLPSIWGNDLYNRVQFDGHAPMVDKLPVAGPAYSQRTFAISTATGDVTYRCVKTATGYAWQVN